MNNAGILLRCTPEQLNTDTLNISSVNHFKIKRIVMYLSTSYLILSTYAIKPL